MQNDRQIPTNQYVCKKILDKVGKPENFFKCNSLNVFDRGERKCFRVNIYTRESVEGLTGDRTRIAQSYFVELKGDDITIVS